MKRADLETFLGKMVELKLFDGSVIRGCLRKTQDETFKGNPNLYLPKNYYFVTENTDSKVCSSCLFRSSHVRKVVE
jgi:hypothetical protein